MRQRKFQAWHEDAQDMLTEFYPGEVFQWLRQGQPLKIREWTGLTDRNGKDVYEGDFLKCNIPVEIIDNGLNSLDGETVIAKVLFENGCFMAEAKTVNYPWVLNGDKTILSWLLDIKAYDRYTVTSEIIGNIYEDGDLLDSKGSEGN